MPSPDPPSGGGTYRRVAHSFVPPGSATADIASRFAAQHCDLVEIDVMAHAGRLLIAHSPDDLTLPNLVEFDVALAALHEQLPASVDVIVDLKGAGFEGEVVESVRRASMEPRTLISSMSATSLGAVRALAPEIRLGWSVPRARRNYLANPLTRPLALLALAYYRRVLPARAARRISEGEVDVLMAHWGVITRRLCAAVGAAGGEVYAWTVDERERLRVLEEVGVAGVITNDPRLFDASAAG